LPHPHISPTADRDATAGRKLTFFSGLGRRQGARIIELDLAPAHCRPPTTTIWRRREEERAIAAHTPQERKPQFVDRLKKRRDGVLRIDRQNLIRRPTVLSDELFELRRAESERIGLRAEPSDLERQRPRALAHSLAQQREPMTRLHAVGAVDITDLDGARLWPVIIAGVEDPHAPRPEFFSPLLRWVITEPVESRCPQSAQPVVLFNRLGQLLFGSSQCLIQAAPVIGKHCAERQFDRRAGARPRGQCVDQIEQDRRAGSQTGGDSVSKFLYTFDRGGFCFHTTSLPLVFASREAERPPFICPNSWSKDYEYLPETSEAIIRIAMIRLMLARLT
jgi:hypothetical protein